MPTSAPEKIVVQTMLLMKRLLHSSDCISLTEVNDKLDHKGF